MNKLRLLYDNNNEILNAILNNNLNNFDRTKQLSNSQENLKNAYLNLYQLLNGKFDNKKEEETFEFIKYFLNKVIMSVMTTSDEKNGLRLFQNINDRGVSLTKTDLLKNLLFIKSDDKDGDFISKKWKKFIEKLEEGFKSNKNITPDRFLRHYLMVRFGDALIKKENVFNYITKEDNLKRLELDGNGTKIFLEDLINKANRYVDILIKGKIGDVEYESLKNLRYLRTSHQILLLLFINDNLPVEIIKDFTIKIENLLFIYSITGKLTKEFEKSFCDVAQIIKNIDTWEKYNNDFVEGFYKTELKEREKLFRRIFPELSQNNLQQYRQKYILAKLEQILEKNADINTDVMNIISNSKNEIEHIFPQTPSEDLLKRFEEYLNEGETVNEYIYSVANLTLLPKSLNVVAKNKPLDAKREDYLNPAQNFLLTKFICEKIKIGQNSNFNRFIENVNIDTAKGDIFSKDDINKRKTYLLNMALFIWGFRE